MKARILILSVVGFIGIFATEHVEAKSDNISTYAINPATPLVEVIGGDGYIKVILPENVDQANIKVYQEAGITLANIDTYLKETTMEFAPGFYIVEVWIRKAGTIEREVHKVVAL